MDAVSKSVKSSAKYIKAFIKWIVIACVVGLVGGVVGSAFHLSVDYVTELRLKQGWLVYLLPVGGLAIAGMYSLFASKGKIDTNRILDSVRDNKNVPIVMLPLIFISTVITHMLGGSAGREGAALQLGGSIGNNLGRILKLNEKDMRMTVMAGMSGVFSALFGTPLTAAIFSIEVTSVGTLRYTALLPCTVSAICAYRISMLFGITPVRFSGIEIAAFSVPDAARAMVLAALCAVVSIVFCTAIKKCEKHMVRLMPNRYLRAVVGGALIVVLTLALGTRDYNGAGMDVITRAIGGQARYEAFMLKIIFTAITISAGFKGGEIVPSFFIGSTFGCVAGGLLGLDPGFGAALGFVSLFCGVVNCPVASLLLSVEVFGAEGMLFFALTCATSYMLSGNFGLYKSQRIVYSKIDAKFIDANTK